MKKEFTGQFTVLNDRGLHTRPSTEIVKAVSHFKCDVTLKYKSIEVNARSLLGVLMLAAERGAKILVNINY
jgi:phosphocarrier protein HPr